VFSESRGPKRVLEKECVRTVSMLNSVMYFSTVSATSTASQAGFVSLNVLVNQKTPSPSQYSQHLIHISSTGLRYTGSQKKGTYGTSNKTLFSFSNPIISNAPSHPPPTGTPPPPLNPTTNISHFSFLGSFTKLPTVGANIMTSRAWGTTSKMRGSMISGL
jgi:hypothetical protein